MVLTILYYINYCTPSLLQEHNVQYTYSYMNSKISISGENFEIFSILKKDQDNLKLFERTNFEFQNVIHTKCENTKFKVQSKFETTFY